jgi:uncharacterized protein (DUF2236 family)
MGRYDIARRIATLDPERDHAQIMHYLAGYEFPWDYIRALEMALYRTFCAPTTSALLDQTREFHERPQRRYDDTALLMGEIVEWGYDSDRGKESLRRINRFHRTYDIANEDFLYVLSTFHLEPVRWIGRFGWRSLTPNEVRASYFFWREVGRRMNIRDIPPDHEAFETWSLEHERTHFAYSDANKRVATATRELFVSWAPRPLHGIVRTAIHSLLDDTMRTCFGFPAAPKSMTTFVTAALRTRGRLLRLFPGHTRKQFITTKPQRSWPTGYAISDLGPPPLIAAERKRTSS